MFFQLGNLFEEERSAVLELAGRRIRAREFATADPGTIAQDAHILVVDGLDELLGTRGESLGGIRERTMSVVESGTSVAIVSRSPKTAFPETVGSDVIYDAKQIFAIPGEVDPADLEDVDFVALSIRELGDRTIIALADALWESGLSPTKCLDHLDRVHQEALRGAGLVQVDQTKLRWMTGLDHKLLRRASAMVASETTSFTPALPDTFTNMWILERAVRNAIRKGLMTKMGEGWRENSLEEPLRSEVIGRAQRDSHPSARRARDLRDPLEWLSTTEMLDLRERRQLGELGLASHMWSRLRTEIVPIRNRVAHMRMISNADALTIEKWRKIVVQSLS
ncbi:hypothetical protein [Myceligenerans crystallogenes]|uniref:hypothetical protein n=1 Tax=Myceligenerans crystallogenes TaxID=316335 RepID=UPI0031DE4772